MIKSYVHPSAFPVILVRKLFPHYWPFARGIHPSSAVPLTNGQFCGALVFPLFLTLIRCWTNSRIAGDWRRCDTHTIFPTIIVTTHMTTLQYRPWLTPFLYSTKRKVKWKNTGHVVVKPRCKALWFLTQGNTQVIRTSFHEWLKSSQLCGSEARGKLGAANHEVVKSLKPVFIFFVKPDKSLK